jgi:tripartite-type tricarboxylate transporter receptor subunit TctC
MELLKTKAGIDLLHVPYRGGSPAYTDVFAGRVDLQADPMFASIGNVRAGKVKAIAIMSPERAPGEPEIPTIAETIPGFDVRSISGIVVPSATPRDLVRRISADIGTALQTPDLRERMKAAGMEPAGSTPEAFDRFIRDEIEKWAAVVKASGAKAD